MVITDRSGIGTIIYPEMLTRSSLLPITVGFSCERSAADPKDPTSLRNAVLRVADPDAANTIAQGMAAGGLNMPPAVLKTASMIPTEPIRAVPIPAHPEATGILLVHQEGDQRIEEVIAVSAHGPYVLLQVARSPQGPEQAAAPAGRALDQQLPLIDSFVPTDPAQFASLPLDPSGLLARTLPLKPGQGTTMSDGTYDRAGALQLEDDPVAAQPALDGAGVDVVSVSQSTVYQAADPSGAQRLASALGEDGQRPARLTTRRRARPCAESLRHPGRGWPRAEVLVHCDDGSVCVQNRCAPTGQCSAAAGRAVPHAGGVGCELRLRRFALHGCGFRPRGRRRILTGGRVG